MVETGDDSPAAAWGERACARGGPLLDAASLARLLFDCMGDKQLEDIVLLDLRPVSLVSDYFVIGTADNARQLGAVVGALAECSRAEGGPRAVLTEGEPASGWVLVDFGDVVAHVFARPQRAFYTLEAMWSGAPLVARMA